MIECEVMFPDGISRRRNSFFLVRIEIKYYVNENDELIIHKVTNAFNQRYHLVRVLMPENVSVNRTEGSIVINRVLRGRGTLEIEYELRNRVDLPPRYEIRPRVILGDGRSIVCAEERTVNMAILTILFHKESKDVIFSLSVPQNARISNVPPVIKYNTNDLEDLARKIKDLIIRSPHYIPNITINTQRLYGIGNQLLNTFKLNSIDDSLIRNNIEYLLIQGNVHFIPWEILNSKENELWGLKYSMSRWKSNKSLEGYPREVEITLPIKILVVISEFNINLINLYRQYKDDFNRYVDQKNEFIEKMNIEEKYFEDLYYKYKELVDMKIIKIGVKELHEWENGNSKPPIKIELQAFTSDPIDPKTNRLRKRTWEEHADGIQRFIAMHLIPSKYDIIHFVGENLRFSIGNKAAVYAYITSPIPSYTKNIHPDFIKNEILGGQELPNDRKAKLVFMNMCNTASSDFINSDINYEGFIDVALMMGLNFIGPFNEISADVAPIFANIFYNKLFEELFEEGSTKPIATILKETRREYKDKIEDDANWAWYVHYGDPLSRFVIRIG
ncbi:MAG: hypothetical protein ACP6IS_10035 [Candidatus Asgardarchaeia archaeon]